MPAAAVLDPGFNFAGSLDTSFGSSGRVTTAYDLGAGKTDEIRDIAIQQDGKIVTVGHAQRSATDFDFAVTRYNANGTLDTTFSGDGKVTISFGSAEDRATGVAIDSSGRIVVVGFTKIAGLNPNDYDFAVARLAASGSLDTSFSGDGKVTIAFDQLGGRQDDRATGVAIDGFGRIVVGGFAQYNGNDYNMAAARLSFNGAIDTSFSGDGKQVVNFGLSAASDDCANGVAVDSSNRVILGGYAQGAAAGDYDFAAARLTSAGAFDTTFDGDGRRTVAFNLRGFAQEDVATAVAVDAFGRVVLGGYARCNGSDIDFAAARLTANGNLDTSFDFDGKQTVAFDLGGGLEDRANAMTLDASGRIVLAGCAQRDNTGDFDMAVARLNANGSRDTTFDGDGRQTVAFTLRGVRQDDGAYAVAVDAQGRIVLGGTAQYSGSDYDMALARIRGS